MLVLAGAPLGLRCKLYDPAADAPGGQVAPLTVGSFDDLDAVAAFARDTDVVTVDWENVPVAAARAVAGLTRMYPSPRALATAQDRLSEKRLFARLGIPAAPCAPVDGRDGLERAARRVGLPGLLKTRRLGYDGKGQFLLRRPDDLDAAWEQLGGQPLVYERLLRFSQEVSLLAVRSPSGETATYPLARNEHRNGMLAITYAPFGARALQRQAEEYMRVLLGHLHYVGVLCIEFFVVDGALVANEIAPRVHNSGHWTIEGADTSQFENHLRAISGLPLGRTRSRGHAVMVNLVGSMPERRRVLALSGVHLHDYGKEPRPGRKLGHLCYVGSTPRERDRAARVMLQLAGGSSTGAAGLARGTAHRAPR
jgi:5-(carboxyamino)imidazole ribonucleotide synthase